MKKFTLLAFLIGAAAFIGIERWGPVRPNAETVTSAADISTAA